MNWNNALLDEKPQHHQLVMISADGVYHVTRYDRERDVYRLSDEPDTFYDPARQLIYWMDLQDLDK